MKNEIKGELSIFLSCAFFATAAILVKYVSNNFNSPIILVFRFLVGIIFGIIILKLTKRKFQIFDKKVWALRGIFGALATFLFYVAIHITSSGRAILLVNTYPIFVALFSYLFFKEQLTIRNIFSICLCLIGVLFVFYDGSSYDIRGDIIALLAGVSASFAVLYLKKTRVRNNPVIVYLSSCMFGLIFIPFSISQINKINLFFFFLLFLIGLIGLFGQLFMSYGYKYVSATKGSIISYTTIPITIVLSYFINEEFKLKFFIGIGFIIAGLINNRTNTSNKKMLNAGS